MSWIKDDEGRRLENRAQLSSAYWDDLALSRGRTPGVQKQGRFYYAPKRQACLVKRELSRSLTATSQFIDLSHSTDVQAPNS